MMGAVLHLPENTRGRDFVVGDIHGAFDMLERALTLAGFDPEKDRLISVGDLIDRGSQSPRALEFLQKPWFFALRGNHEDLFMDTVSADGAIDGAKAAFNVRNGMGWILNRTAAELKDIRAAFEKLPLAIEIPTARGTVGFVHAEVPAGMDWDTFKDKITAGDEQTIQTALWGRARVQGGDDSGVAGIDRIFFGHTPQQGGVTRLANGYYVDTGAVFRSIMDDGRADKFFLTLGNIMAGTLPLSAPQKPGGEDTRIIPEKSEKPFGKYIK